ncbi:MAG: NAD(P)-dependent alcohol dehydrogenase [Myxococcales bacterium]|nr:NAD(P)-dependent alcohol dehydrogenase [Myxococcales bacterium]MCB9649976.1 NAD(P)-dependent alcohol dehydrogenase [Deltaproteobacteria bacterium]
MRAYEITQAFGLENLKVVERPRPEPGPGQVAVAVSAVSLNYRDLLMVRGHYNPRQPLPLVPCSDGAGTVRAVGPGVSRVKVGDRVASCFFQGWSAGAVPRDKAALRSTLGGPLGGTLAEEVILEEGGVVAAPAGLSDEEVATLPCAALTAYSALLRQGGLQPGDTLLIQGTGGVALFGLAFAKMAGARVIITSSSDEKLERARALGADETINYKSTPEWGKAARALTDGAGVDHVLELGGAGTMQESLRAVRAGGHISLIGVLAGGAAKLDLTPVLMQNVRIQGVLVGSRSDFEAMNRAIVQHDLRPVIDRTFAFDEAPAAFEHMGAAAHFGKICVRVG